MLQLKGTLKNATVRIIPLLPWRIYTQQLLATSSRAANPSPVLVQPEEKGVPTIKPKRSNEVPIQSQNTMIQAAFDQLATTNIEIPNKNECFMSKMKEAKDVEGLLTIASEMQVTRENAFAIVAMLLDWVNNGKAQLKSFELDGRFMHLCTLMARPLSVKPYELKRERYLKRLAEDPKLFYMNDINEVDQEVSHLPLTQMIKIMTGLASQKKRSKPLLRALSSNIGHTNIALNIKQLSDLLYSMAILNYADEVLLQKVCSDLMQSRHAVPTSSVMGSMLRSLGTLRYKNQELIDKLSEWVVDSSKEMRPQDLSTFFVTLALLGYTPMNVEVIMKVVVEQLKETDMTKPSEWLDIVWSLTVLQLVEDRHIASVLNCNFISKITDSVEVPALSKQKLLNINGAAELLMKDYKGPFLQSDPNFSNENIHRCKDKVLFSKTVTATLENIFAPPEYCKMNIDTGMGFLLDAEICVDREGKKLPVESKIDAKKGLRIAVVAQSYHDFCRGKQELVGYYNFYSRLLEAKGYKILAIPYTEFNTEEKIVKRITYINDRVKSIAT